MLLQRLTSPIVLVAALTLVLAAACEQTTGAPNAVDAPIERNVPAAERVDPATDQPSDITSTPSTTSTSTSTSTTTSTTTTSTTTTTTTLAPALEAEALVGEVTPSTTAPPPSGVVGAWRAAYLPHGWIGTEKPGSFVVDAVAELAAAGFDRQIHNIGAFDASGSIPAADYRGLASWVANSRAAAPDQSIIAWVSGDEEAHVDDLTTHDSIAAWIATTVATHGLDGMLLDFEPFSPDNPHLVDLLTAIRTRVPSIWIGIAAPAPASRWSPAFITSVASHVDALSPMLYDSEIDDIDSYIAWSIETVERYRGAAGTAAVVPSIPAYSANRWHDPAVENIATAGEAFAAIGGVDGAAVYWWWEFDQDDLRHWNDVQIP